MIQTSPAQRQAFTLVEIALSLAIISTALLAIIALLPMGADAGREASNKSIIALILEDIHKNLEGQPLEAITAPLIYNYDEQGKFIEDISTSLSEPRYLAKVLLSDVAIAPANTTDLIAARISLYWPVDPATGIEMPSGSDADKTVTYYVTTMAGTSWETVDSNYTPKIEF